MKKSELDKLIEQVLTENVSITIQDLKDAGVEDVEGEKFKNLSNLDKNPTDISDADLEDLVKNYSSQDDKYKKARTTFDDIVSKTKRAQPPQKGKGPSNTWKKRAKVLDTFAKAASVIPDFDIDAIDYEEPKQSVAEFDLRNAQMSTQTPKLTPVMKNIFESLSLDGQTLYERVDKLNKFAQNIMSLGGDYKAKTDGGKTTKDLGGKVSPPTESAAKAALNQMGLLKFTQYALIVDYLSTLARQLDSGSGAYMFEVFLAMLAGGTVAGKSTTEKGKMGGVDLTFGGTELASGSSKYLRAGGSASQAPGGFEKTGEYVHYIVAKKVVEDALLNKKYSSADVEGLLGLEIYYVVVFVKEAKEQFEYYKIDPISNSPKKAEMGLLTIGSKHTKLSSSKKATKVVIPTNDDQFKLGTLQLVRVREESFRSVLETAVTKLDDNLKLGFKEIQRALDTSVDMKRSVSDYSSSGKAAAADNVITQLVDLKEALSKMFDVLEQLGNTGYEQATDSVKAKAELEPSPAGPNESKSSFDQLIETIIKQKLLK